MSFYSNTTGFSNSNVINVELYQGINSALHLLLFTVFPLPTIGLCIVCILALLLAKGIGWKMRVILINILIPDIITSLASSVSYLGYPLRVYSTTLDSCRVFISLYLTASYDSTFVGPFFAVSIYIFVKYDMKRLKWWIILSYIISSSVLSTTLGAIQFGVDTTMA